MPRKRLVAPLAFRVKASTLQELQDIADAEDKDLSELLRGIVEGHLKWRREHPNATKKRKRADET